MREGKRTRKAPDRGAFVDESKERKHRMEMKAKEDDAPTPPVVPGRKSA